LIDLDYPVSFALVAACSPQRILAICGLIHFQLLPLAGGSFSLFAADVFANALSNASRENR